MASLTSHLEDDVQQPLPIRMTNFSHYQQSGKVWHSPPFYYTAGHKMQLAVYANGTGAGAGTHVSIVLLRMKGEDDDQLPWTEDVANEYHMHIKIATHEPAQELQSTADFFQNISRPKRVSGAEDVREEEREEKFCDLQTIYEPSIPLE